MFGHAKRKNIKTIETVGELIEYLESYDESTPVTCGMDDGVQVLVHENADDPREIEIHFEEVEEGDFDEDED